MAVEPVAAIEVGSGTMLTTIPGLEPLLAAALGGTATAPGWVAVPRPAEAVRRSRLAIDRLEPWVLGSLDPGQGLNGVRAAAAAAWPLLSPQIPAPLHFRVRSVRRGRHPYDRIAVERAVGAVVARATGWPVRLEAPALVLRADVMDARLLIGGLRPWPDRDEPRPFNQRVGVSPVVAAAAAELGADGPPPGAVLDPFCGAGTLLVEAGRRFGSARLIGGDWTAAAAEGALRNIEAAGLADRAEIHHRDARHLAADHNPGSIDLVLSNPPFGLRIGRSIRFVGFYRRLLFAVRTLSSPSGRLVLLVHRLAQLEAAAEVERFAVTARLPLALGDSRPTLVRLEPLRGERSKGASSRGSG